MNLRFCFQIVGLEEGPTLLALPLPFGSYASHLPIRRGLWVYV